MSSEHSILREQLQRIAAAKAAAREEDARYWLSLPPDERVMRAVAHCDALLRSFPPSSAGSDDEAEAWARVNRRLQAGR